MARNPLDDAPGGGSSGGPLEPGNARTIVDPKSGKVITAHRTARPYAYDLADAYNAAMIDDARRRGLQWYVAPSGEVKLGDDQQWTARHTADLEARAERERLKWLRRNRPRDDDHPRRP